MISVNWNGAVLTSFLKRSKFSSVRCMGPASRVLRCSRYSKACVASNSLVEASRTLREVLSCLST